MSTKNRAAFLLWVLVTAALAVTGVFLAVIGVLGIVALAAPGYWPTILETKTILPGYALPTVTGYGRAIFCATYLVQGAAVVLVLVPLAGIIRSAVANDPFAGRNVTRLRVIASAFALIFVAHLVTSLVSPFWATVLLDQPPATPVDGRSLFMALLALSLAEVFREGLRLRADVEGTI